MHSAAHAMHIVMQACIMAIMLSMSIAAGRIIMRIIVLHMSAQFMHIAMHLPMSAMLIELLAHMVHACSQAEHASIRSCMALMSMPSIEAVELLIIPIMSMEKCYVVLRRFEQSFTRN